MGNLKRKYLLCTLLLVNVLSYSQIIKIGKQEHNKIEKIRMGKYKYEIYLKENYNYEYNRNAVNYILRFRDKEQYLGTYLVYRKTGSSKKYRKKISKELPPDHRSLYKDGIIIKEGEIKIDKKNKRIIVIEETFHKDYESNFEKNKVKRIYKQGKNGCFYLENDDEKNALTN